MDRALVAKSENMIRTNFTLPVTPIDTIAASAANQITESYYNFLIGEINRGVIRKAVCARYCERFNYATYHLISL